MKAIEYEINEEDGSFFLTIKNIDPLLNSIFSFNEKVITAKNGITLNLTWKNPSEFHSSDSNINIICSQTGEYSESGKARISKPEDVVLFREAMEEFIVRLNTGTGLKSANDILNS